MTAGELITLLQAVDANTDIFIRITVSGGTSTVQVNGFTTADTVMTKPMESFTTDSVA